MAKDDYDVIVFKVLLYLYGCLKRKCEYNQRALDNLIHMEEISELYFADVIRMMQEEKLIDGVIITKVWGKEYILMNSLSDAKITQDGIHYLTDNSKMKDIKDTLRQSGNLAASLINLVFPARYN